MDNDDDELDAAVEMPPSEAAHLPICKSTKLSLFVLQPVPRWQIPIVSDIDEAQGKDASASGDSNEDDGKNLTPTFDCH